MPDWELEKERKTREELQGQMEELEQQVEELEAELEGAIDLQNRFQRALTWSEDLRAKALEDLERIRQKLEISRYLYGDRTSREML